MEKTSERLIGYVHYILSQYGVELSDNLYVTDKRLIFIRTQATSTDLSAFGLIGALVGGALDKSDESRRKEYLKSLTFDEIIAKDDLGFRIER